MVWLIVSKHFLGLQSHNTLSTINTMLASRLVLNLSDLLLHSTVSGLTLLDCALVLLVRYQWVGNVYISDSLLMHLSIGLSDSQSNLTEDCKQDQ